MNQFNLKRINIVGFCAAILAFIFAFLPIKKVVLASSYLDDWAEGGYKTSYSLVNYNFFGTLFLLVIIALIVLFVLQALGNSHPTLNAVTTVITIAALVVFILSVIISNDDIKQSEELIDQYSVWFGDVIKIKFGAGFVLELIVTIILAASYWINELLIIPYVYNARNYRPVLNPFTAFASANKGYGAANAQYNPNFQAQPGQFQGQPGQFQGQPNQFQAQPGQFQGQPNQFQAQPQQAQPNQFQGQPNQFQAQPQNPQPTQTNSNQSTQTFGGFNNQQ